jgi:hypothetical protein
MYKESFSAFRIFISWKMAGIKVRAIRQQNV